MMYGTWLPQTAVLVGALSAEDRVRFARGMLDFARDGQESGHNRYDALLALRSVARTLPDVVRDELFEEVLPFARRDSDDESTGVEHFPGANDLLRRFTVNIGDASLAAAGVLAAAALARAGEQYAIVERVAVKLLPDANEGVLNSIASALASIPVEQVTLPVDVLSAHPSPWLRALAAVLWAQRPTEPEEIGLRLARDRSRQVRGSLAGGVKDEVRHASVREILIGDPRRSVRRQIGNADNASGAADGS
jgi:hypothetical protein